MLKENLLINFVFLFVSVLKGVPKKMRVEFDQLPGGKISQKRAEGAAGYDVFTYEDRVIIPGKRGVFPLGFQCAIQKGYYGQLKIRSGIALRNEVTVDAGTIDPDYRGPVKMLSVNHSDKEFFVVSEGYKTGQMIFSKHEEPEFVITDKLDKTGRGEGDFDSTGLL